MCAQKFYFSINFFGFSRILAAFRLMLDGCTPYFLASSLRETCWKKYIRMNSASSGSSKWRQEYIFSIMSRSSVCCSMSVFSSRSGISSDLRSKLHKKERYLIFLDSAHVPSLGRRLCRRLWNFQQNTLYRYEPVWSFVIFSCVSYAAKLRIWNLYISNVCFDIDAFRLVWQ